MSYDRSLQRWIPAGFDSITPDGTRYVYADHNQQLSTFHVVDIKTGVDRTFGPAGPWVGVGQDDSALYVMRVEFIQSAAFGTLEKSDGLWKIPFDGSGPVQLTSDSRRWTWVAAGGVYGDMSTVDVAGAPNQIARFDVRTGHTELWFDPHSRSRVVAVDEQGAAFVMSEAAGEVLWRVPSPNSAAQIWSGSVDTIRPEGPVAIDGTDVWFSSSSLAREWAIFRYSASGGLQQMADFTNRPITVAGPCA